MNQTTNRPVIGFSTAFTGKYKSSRMLFRFLELMNLNTVKSSVTIPEIIEAGSTLASADYCLPLRAYIGHIYHLTKKHPEINYLLIPIIKSEHTDSGTCAKYRDLDGVIVRSLGNITGYRLNKCSEKSRIKMYQLLNEGVYESIINNSGNLPEILAPEIESTKKEHLRMLCIQIYSSIYDLSKIKEINYINGKMLFGTNQKTFKMIEEAIEQAYKEIFENNKDIYKKLILDKYKPRLALVGRDYLVDDPALSAGIKDYFEKNGVVVLTSQEIPEKYIKDKMDKVNGFYDAHKIAQAFVDTVFNQVDGYVLIGSFGCHPDGFQIEYLSKYISDKGKACWTFKYDEQAGGVGFQTRYETILWFLQQKSAERINECNSNNTLVTEKSNNFSPIKSMQYTKNTKPIFIWPYMGDGVDLILKEIWYSIGLSEYLYPPKPVNEETIHKGEKYYSETCSPFALYIGSLKETLDRLLIKLTEELKEKDKKIESKRIIILMANGKGPCTFGWYAIVGKDIILEEYEEKFDRLGHSIEMITIDNQGRNLNTFLMELAEVSTNSNISQLLNLLSKNDKNSFLNSVLAPKDEIQTIILLKKIVLTGWKKLLTYEDIQNKALQVRAHEKNRGSTTRILKESIIKLEKVHTIEDIYNVKNESFIEFEAIPQDKEVKPKVVIVGEIYGTLTSFANRGAVNNLLGLAGIEGVEGLRLSHFITGALKGLKKNYISSRPVIRNLIKFQESKGYYQQNKWVREPTARPFLEHEIGGDGQPSVAKARNYIENVGVDGILHIYPFKCMPEAMAKDALKEMAKLYGVKSLHISYDKEIEIERLKTEVSTFSALLIKELEHKQNNNDWKDIEIKRRQKIGHTINQVYSKSTK